MNEHISQAPLTGTTPEPGSSRPAETTAGIKGSLREARESLKSKASAATAQAKEHGQEYLQQNKARAADRLQDYSESVRETAERFERERDPNIAHYTSLMADKLERAAAYVRERDFRDLRRDAEELARRHPAVFFGGMFVTGLALARFFKASTDRLDSESGPEIPPGPEINPMSAPPTPYANPPATP